MTIRIEKGSLDMKVALIVGATGAIGSATARLLLDNGYELALLGRSAEKLEKMRSELDAVDHVRCFAFEEDDMASAASAVIAAGESFDGLTAVVNAAGMFDSPTPAEELTFDEIERVMRVNFYLPSQICTASIPFLKKRGGSIVNIAATDANGAALGFAAESAAKSALVSFSRTIAADLGKFGIRVNTVSPGWVATDMSIPYLKENGFLDNRLKVPLVGRIGTSEDIAEVISFLVSQRSRYINGTNIVADGGQLDLIADVAIA